MYSKVRLGKTPIYFLFRIVWNNEILYHHCFQLCFRIRYEEGLRKRGKSGMEWSTLAPGLCWQC